MTSRIIRSHIYPESAAHSAGGVPCGVNGKTKSRAGDRRGTIKSRLVMVFAAVGLLQFASTGHAAEVVTYENSRVSGDFDAVSGTDLINVGQPSLAGQYVSPDDFGNPTGPNDGSFGSAAFWRNTRPAPYAQFSLDVAAKPDGYDITKIRVVAGWGGNADCHANQDFDVYIRTVDSASLTLFGSYLNAPYGTSNGGPHYTRTTITDDSGLIASGVAEIQFNFTHQCFGGNHPGLVLLEIDVLGIDADGDGVADAEDNCVDDPNPLQEDFDGDGEGDACDGDFDGDEVLNELDNCPLVFNEDQSDVDFDGTGDVCDSSYDTGSVIDEAELVAGSAVDNIVDAGKVPGGSGMISKLQGNGSVIAKVNGAVTGYDDGMMDLASYIESLEAALNQLGAFDNQLEAAIAKGKIGEPNASEITAASADIRAVIQSLIDNAGL